MIVEFGGRGGVGWEFGGHAALRRVARGPVAWLCRHVAARREVHEMRIIFKDSLIWIVGDPTHATRDQRCDATHPFTLHCPLHAVKHGVIATCDRTLCPRPKQVQTFWLGTLPF